MVLNLYTLYILVFSKMKFIFILDISDIYNRVRYPIVMKEKLNENIMKVLMNESNYLSAETIAKRLNVNEKTIRRRILQMQGDMLAEIGRIVSKKGSGYKLVIENKEEFSKYYDYVVAEVQINNPMNRRTAIFEHLIYHSYSKKEELLNKFFISEVTLMADIKMLNEYTKRNNVQIKLFKKRGYFVTGDEYHKRNTLLKLIYASGAVGVRKREHKIARDNIMNTVIHFFTSEGYFINKHTLDSITNYLLISIGGCQKPPIEDPAHFQLVEGAVSLFEQLKEKGIPMTIASASIKENMDFFIAHFHLANYFDTNVFVYDDGSYRNKTDMFLQSAKNLHVTAKECVIIEDSVSGVQCANAVDEYRVIVINEHKEWFTNLRVDAFISDFANFNIDQI